MEWMVRNDALLVRLVCAFIIVRTYDAVRTKDVRSEFHSHYVIHPKLHMLDGREKRDVSSKEEHENEIIMTFENLGQQFTLDLKMNMRLLPANYFEKYYYNSTAILNRPMKKSRRHCHYQGHIRGYPKSWAAISTCKGISGMLFDGNETYYVHPDDNNNDHLLLKASEWKSQNLTCGYKKPFDDMLRSEMLHSLHRHRRSTILHPPPGSNRDSRYVELILVNDYKEFKEYKEDVDSVFDRSKQIANILNGLYMPLNIYIALIGVITWSEKDPITMSPDGDATLTNFLHYRRERLAREHPNDNAQLITAMTFDGGVVGKALKGPICTYEYSGGVNMDHSNVVSLVATTVAHELGHNFGMEHDTDECDCPDEKCIMAPASSFRSPHHWSSCSREYLSIAYKQGMDYCLRNIPSDIVGPICGNGFLEEGEECDCGWEEFCNNPCCNSTTCRLNPNATCATGSCCNLQTCQVKEVATMCHSSISECDLPEYCDGVKEYCPTDVHVQDGTECNDGKGYCYDGKCQSHSSQCRLIWGHTGKSSHHQCYDQNTKGNVNGNCGYDRLNKTYKECSKKDVRCGMLQCTHLNERLEFGMESTAILSRSFITTPQGRILPCKTALIDLGLNSFDPGLTPNGAKCGEDMACLNQKCVPVSVLKKKSCPQNCNGNGVCNCRSNCHCNYGYAPPLCDGPGNGGSIDSGPPSDPNAGQSFFIVMLVLFLVIIPLIAVLSYLIYHYHHHLKNWWFLKIQKPSTKCEKKPASQPPKKFNYPHGTITKLEISAPFLQQGPSDPIVTVPLETAQKQMQNGHIRNIKTSQESATRPVPTRPAPLRPDGVQRSHSAAGATSSRRTSRPLSEAAVSKRNLPPPPPRPPPPKHTKAVVRPQSFSAGSNNTNRLSNNGMQALNSVSELPPKNKLVSNQNQHKNTAEVNNATVGSSTSKSSAPHTNKPDRQMKPNSALKPIAGVHSVRKTSGQPVSRVASLTQKFEQQGGVHSKNTGSKPT